jgi:predicted RNA binding protein YcfA (HicA-like mRNA interferase family)
MSREDKLKDKLQGDGSFTWNELKSLLGKLGWTLLQGSGSRVKFTKTVGDEKPVIFLHKPHPGNEIKHYLRAQIIEQLEAAGDL